jgi:hypothetical protein
MYACKSLKMQGILCIEIYAQKCERNSIRGRRIFIGFPDKFAKPAFYAGLVSLDFTGHNRRGALNVQISAVIATQLRKACISQVSESAAGADATQRLPLWEWNLSYLEKRRVRPVPHRVRPQRAGLPLRRNNRENDRHYTRQGLHPNQLSHYKWRVADFEWQWRSERSQTRDRTLLANLLLQRSRQPLHGRWDPGSLFALKKRNREFGITSHFRFWPGAP